MIFLDTSKLKPNLIESSVQFYNMAGTIIGFHMRWYTLKCVLTKAKLETWHSSPTSCFAWHTKSNEKLTLEKASASKIEDAGTTCRRLLCKWSSQICTKRESNSWSATMSTFSVEIVSSEGQASVYKYSNTAKKLIKSIPCKCTWEKTAREC